MMNYQNLKIGIIGAASIFSSNEIYVEEPFHSINQTISKIKDQCDVLILLFNASDSDYKKLSTLDLNVDFIVRGNTRRRSTSGGGNNIPIYSVGDKGKVLYQFDLKYNSFLEPLIDIAYHEKIINTNTKRIKRSKQNENVNEYDKIKAYEKNIQDSRYALEEAKNSLQYKSITLNKIVQDDPRILKIIDEGKERVGHISGPQLQKIDLHKDHNH